MTVNFNASMIKIFQSMIYEAKEHKLRKIIKGSFSINKLTHCSRETC